MIKLINTKLLRSLWLLISFIAFCCLIACGGSKDNEATASNTDTPTAASLRISAYPITVKSNDGTSTTITVTALNSSLNSVSGVPITLSTNTGILTGAQGLVTDSSGKVTATFSSGSSDTDPTGPINRTATITATAGSVSAFTFVDIVGSTVKLTSTGTTLSDNGSSPLTITATALDSAGVGIEGANIVFSPSNGGSVTIMPSSGLADSNGQLAANVTGVAAGSVRLSATALGATGTYDITVTALASTFRIDAQWLNAVSIDNNATTTMTTSDSLAIEVNAPASTTVIFASTLGSWVGGTSYIPVTVVGGKAIATLNCTMAGVISVQVYDANTPTRSDTLTVGVTSGNPPYKITLQASTTVVPKSVGNTTGSSTLLAKVEDFMGYAIANVPIAFRILNPTGGGETVSPVVVFTSANVDTVTGLNPGEARTTFTSGSSSSGEGVSAVQVRASVVGTSVETEAWGVDSTPSGNDAAIVIGSTAASIAFGQATVLGEYSQSQYVLPMSVLVADVNGNAVSGAVVSLSAWPIAWSTGIDCAYDQDGYRVVWHYATDSGTTTWWDVVTGNYGTYYNEDANENLILDAGEDGSRTYFYSGTALATGTIDTQLTPSNAAAGVLPATVTTDANGVAAFNLIYPKRSAIYVVDRIRASTILQQGNTAISAQVIFRLPVLQGDIAPCMIPDSPYFY
jgi:hypothetical protein